MSNEKLQALLTNSGLITNSKVRRLCQTVMSFLIYRAAVACSLVCRISVAYHQESGKASGSGSIISLQLTVDPSKPSANDTAFSSRSCCRPDARGLAVEHAAVLAPAAAGHRGNKEGGEG